MKVFLDTADLQEIKRISKTHIVDGVTTNPSLIKKTGKTLLEVIPSICQIIEGPISAEVLSYDYETMLSEAMKLSKIAKNICIKLPLTPEGLRVCRELSKKKIQTNITLCFSATQALMAAKAGATYVSPFLGRLDDISPDSGIELVEKIRIIFDNYNIQTQILAASIRNITHIEKAAIVKCDAITIPPNLLENSLNHPLTDAGIEIFKKASSSNGVI